MSTIIHVKRSWPQPRRTEYGLLLSIFKFRITPQHGAKIVVLHRLLVFHHPISPFLLALFALHLVLVDSLAGIELRELLLKVLVDIVIHSCEP